MTTTPPTCALFSAQLGSLFECDWTARGYVRIKTPFQYPDGGLVDVFVDGDTVTDFGEALGWLRMQTAGGKRTPRQDALLQDVLTTHGVELHNGQLRSRATPDKMAETIMRVGQAVVRVADIWFTTRTRSMESLADEVQEFLFEREIVFERSPRVVGRSGRDWIPDFRTRAGRQANLLFVLSTGTRGAARRVTDHAAAACMDLGRAGNACVALFDDTSDVWVEEDFRLLEEVSSIARWSKPDDLERILLAA